MSQETAFLRQDAVLWEADGRFDGNGDPVLGPPQAIKLRWERFMRESLSPTESPLTISTTAIVDRDIPIGSQLWLGKLDDLPPDPRPLYHVLDAESIPDIKGVEIQRTIIMARK